MNIFGPTHSAYMQIASTQNCDAPHERLTISTKYVGFIVFDLFFLFARHTKSGDSFDFFDYHSRNVKNYVKFVEQIIPF